MNGNYTGRMYVPHLLSEVNGEADVLVKSPDFFELGTKIAYDFDFQGFCLQLNAGVQNIFNSYQKDFDKGASRDSGYIYGPGSIGACSYPAKVFKGMRMGGQMGGDRVTTHNLQVLKVIPEHNLLLIKGSVPGCKGSIVIIEK